MVIYLYLCLKVGCKGHDFNPHLKNYVWSPGGLADQGGRWEKEFEVKL